MKKSLVVVFAFAANGIFAQNLSNVESVEFDAASHRFFASNGGNIIIVNGEGDEVEYFGADPEADYGMEVMDTVLYTIVGGSVKGFGLTTGGELFSKLVPGADFLNGMASDGDHRIWVTDFGAKKIHELDVTDFGNVTVTEVVANTVSTPNGIVYDAANNRLVFVSWGGSAPIKAVDLSTYNVTPLVTTSLSNCDGIDLDDDGSFYVSSWSPTRITRFTEEFATDEIIIAPGLSSPADICVAPSIDTLAIPNAGNNTITFVNLNPISGNDEITTNSYQLNIFPNPVTDSSRISFKLEKSAEVELLIYDERGAMSVLLTPGIQPPGNYKIFLTTLNLHPGVYICSLRVGSEWITTSFIR
jgi:hypothetical protein